MKKIFSLVCLFVFMFFSASDVIFASTTSDSLESLDILNLTETYKEKVNNLNSEYIVTYDEETNILSIEEEGSDGINNKIILKYLYYKEDNSLILVYKNPDEYDEFYVYLMLSTILEMHEFDEEYYNYFELEDTEFFSEFKFETDGLLVIYNSDDGIEELKVSLGSDFPNSLAEKIEKIKSNLEQPEEPTTEPTSESSSSSTTEKTEDNVDTSDIAVRNIILIGGCLLLITGYGIVKLKKIK